MKLTANPPLLLILITALLLTSCQKEIDIGLPPGTGGTGSNNTVITGDYDFVGLAAKTNSSVIVSTPDGELKSVTLSDYTSQNNVGTVKITASDIILSGLGYSINTIANGKIYLAGALVSEVDQPFDVTIPPTSTTSSYTRINNDSLTVIGAIGVADPSGAVPTGPSGVKISWSGDTLLMKTANSFTQTITQGGETGTLTASVNGIIKLKKR